MLEEAVPQEGLVTLEEVLLCVEGLPTFEGQVSILRVLDSQSMGCSRGQPQDEVLGRSWVKLDDVVPDVFGGPLLA